VTNKNAFVQQARTLLATLYRERGRAEIVATDVLGSTLSINFNGAPIEFWDAILREADAQTKLGDLLAYARRDYSGNPHLQQLARDWAQLSVAGAPATPSRPISQPQPAVVSLAWHEDLPLRFDRAETRAIEEALVARYGQDMMGMLQVTQHATTAGVPAGGIAPMTPPNLYPRELMKAARNANKLVAFLDAILQSADAAAIATKIRTALLSVGADYGALSTMPTFATWRSGDDSVPLSSSSAKERVVNASAGFFATTTMRRHLAEAEARVARITVGGRENGTGFLVGRDLLLTNWHVVESVSASAPGVAQFDFVVPAAGELRALREVAFADAWLLASSAYDSDANERSDDGPNEGKWDYALVRLAEPVGEQPIGADRSATTDPRGWYSLVRSALVFDANDAILVVGHPEGRAMEFSFAAPSGARLTKHQTRLRYRTNTEAGSSGSPVFDKDWRVVALHHAAGPSHDDTWNQGVPVWKIVEHLHSSAPNLVLA